MLFHTETKKCLNLSIDEDLGRFVHGYHHGKTRPSTVQKISIVASMWGNPALSLFWHMHHEPKLKFTWANLFQLNICHHSSLDLNELILIFCAWRCMFVAVVEC